jgi:hypothetical protein
MCDRFNKREKPSRTKKSRSLQQQVTVLHQNAPDYTNQTIGKSAGCLKGHWLLYHPAKTLSD